MSDENDYAEQFLNLEVDMIRNSDSSTIIVLDL